MSAPIQVELNIVNEASAPLTVVDPEVGPPPAELHWTASGQAYRIGVLTSFGVMRLALTDAAGAPVAGKAPVPWVTPLLGERVLQMHERLALEFDLNELFSIDAPGTFLLSVSYGKGEAAGHADMPIEVLAVRGAP